MTLTNSALSDRLDPYRLPRHTVPIRYDLDLEPDLASATFRGRVEIAVVTVEQTDELVLNAVSSRSSASPSTASRRRGTLEDVTERLFVSPIGGVATGEHRLTIEFSGILNDSSAASTAARPRATPTA